MFSDQFIRFSKEAQPVARAPPRRTVVLISSSCFHTHSFLTSSRTGLGPVLHLEPVRPVSTNKDPGFIGREKRFQRSTGSFLN